MADPGPAHSSRVVIVQNPGATIRFEPQAAGVRRMVEQGLGHLARQPAPSTAWRQWIGSNDVVGLKVFSAPGAIVGSRPVVVRAVVESLLAAGLSRDRIIIWDRELADLRLAGFMELGEQLRVRVMSAAAAGFDPAVAYDFALAGNLVFGDVEFGRKGEGVGRKSHVSKLLTQVITRHVVISPLLNHNTAGSAGCLYSLALGAVDNKLRFENNPRALQEAVPEILAMPVFFDRRAVFIVDALIAQYQGEENNRLHYSVVLNQLRFSTDPVALDVLSAGELEAQRKKAGLDERRLPRTLYENAALLELGVADPAKVRVEWVE